MQTIKWNVQIWLAKLGTMVLLPAANVIPCSIRTATMAISSSETAKRTYVSFFFVCFEPITGYFVDTNQFRNVSIVFFQMGDFSVSLKAPGRNKHFRVHVENGMYCIGQRKFHSLDQLGMHLYSIQIN